MKRQLNFKRALQAFEKNPYPLQPLNHADISHLQRWSEDPRCEEIWRRLSGRLFAPPKGESRHPTIILLIEVVLAIRNEAESRENELAALKKSEKSDADRGHRTLSLFKKVAKAATSGKATDHPAVWRERARLFQQAADFCTYEVSRSRPVTGHIAVDRDGSRIRQLFSSRLSEHLRLLTGKCCDQEVAMLTEIALPGKEVTVEMVRRARRR